MGTITQGRMESMPNAGPGPVRRALIVEDQTTLRELLAELLELTAGYAVDACGTGVEARALLAQGQYDLVLLDLVLPDGHGLDLLAELRKAPAPKSYGTSPRIVVLTAHARPAVVRDAMERGAHAVVTKGAPLRELREAIDRVAAGGIYYSSETSRLLREAAVKPERDEQLTERQREILRHVARGLSTKEIAATLSLSEKTVANHRTRIMERIGLHDIASLTRYAIALGLVDPDA
jgi:DNA-binding NarL/FixJ family response regulator